MGEGDKEMWGEVRASKGSEEWKESEETVGWGTRIGNQFTGDEEV